MGKRTQAAQDASFDKHGFDNYMRMIEAYGFANQLEAELEAIQQQDLAQPSVTELIDNPPPLPEPAFRLNWHDDGARYTVSKPNIDSTDCYTADQYRAGEAAAFARGVAVRQAEIDELKALLAIAEFAEKSAQQLALSSYEKGRNAGHNEGWKACLEEWAKHMKGMAEAIGAKK